MAESCWMDNERITVKAISLTFDGGSVKMTLKTTLIKAVSKNRGSETYICGQR